MSGLREAFNVDDLKKRDRLVRRFRKIRAEAVLDRNSYAHWNDLHPNEAPLDLTFWDEVIAWCDGGGEGPIPGLSESDPRYVPRGQSAQ